MKNILSKEQRPTLLDFVRERPLLAFDFDGTLAPIVRDPEAATMRPRTAALLAEVATIYPCVVISGRSRADVMAKVDGIPMRAVFGNHGMEPSRSLRKARGLVARWRAQLASALPAKGGVVIEDKGVSLAVHYRKARARAAVRQRILVATSRLRDTRIVEGKMVVNVVPAGAPDKGTALMTLRKRLRCQSAIYLGDDDNDEDVFALAGRERLLGIRVGRSLRSHAAYFVPGQMAVDRLLVELVALARSSARPQGAHAHPRKPRNQR